MRILVSLCFVAGSCSAQTPLVLRVSDLAAPAGATVQIQVYATTPVGLVSGELVLNLDPSVFGPITAADVFSATGDQAGAANIQDRHLDVSFISRTGGIGRLPGLPILVITVPVLAGPSSNISVTSGAVSWKDDQNVTYSVGTAAGTFKAGGSLSIGSVIPGGGLLPAGTTVRVNGTGFSSATQLTIDGVALKGQTLASSQEIDFTLLAPADLTGKRMTARNPDGTSVLFFPALRGTYMQRPSSTSLSTIQPIFPQQLYPAGSLNGAFCPVCNLQIALQNPSPDPVDVAFKVEITTRDGLSVTASTLTIPPLSIYFGSVPQLTSNSLSTLIVVPTRPIQMLLYEPRYGPFEMDGIPVPVVQPTVEYSDSSPLTFNWKIGSDLPTPVQMPVILYDIPTLFTAASDSTWLLVTPGQATTCTGLGFSSPQCPSTSAITILVDPSKLSSGTYHGIVTLTPQTFGGKSAIVPVVLNVSAATLIVADQTQWDFGSWPADSKPPDFAVHLTTNDGVGPFSVTVSTRSGKNWLAASPVAGTAPATVTITGDPSKLLVPGDSGVVAINGGSNTVAVAVSMETYLPQPLPFGFAPSALTFSAQVGQSPPPVQTVGFATLLEDSPFTLFAQTDDGANWLNAKPAVSGLVVNGVSVNVNPAGLAPGTYHGTVTVTSSLNSTPGQVPVTLVIWSSAQQITLSTESLSFTGMVRKTIPSQSFDVATGGTPMYYTISTLTLEGNGWLTVATGTSPTSPVTPVTVTVNVDTTLLTPGVYHGSVTINAGYKASVSVVLTVTPGPAPLPETFTLPLVTSSVNAASFLGGGVAPGEIVTLLGQNIGPATPAGLVVSADGKVATMIGGVQVLFEGTPAPLLYASATQINAIVPYEVAGKSEATVQVQFGGQTIPVGAIPVVPAAPGVFAVVNQDSTLNSAAHPATQGSVLQVFATGEGVVTPAGITGEITGSDVKQPVLPVSVTIAGSDAPVLYAESAPEAVAGLLQVNAIAVKGGTLTLSIGTASATFAVAVQ